jgi:hypothetical protein
LLPQVNGPIAAASAGFLFVPEYSTKQAFSYVSFT